MKAAQSIPSQPDLSVCEQEPIHIPGFIEPNGALVVLDAAELRFLQASTNTGTLLGIEAQGLPGRHASAILDARTLEALARMLKDDRGTSRCYMRGVRISTVATLFDLSVHTSNGLLILEFELAGAGSDPDEAEFLNQITEGLGQLQSRRSFGELCEIVAGNVRQLTGFDRVMVYRFLDDGTGVVIAENRREDLSPYLGLRYPASDIPSQARQLYLLNRIRVKADVAAERVPVLPALNPLTGASLDMSFCILRAMSPVHVEYLRNMGVQASMSVSIVREGALWGLIACHHMQPQVVPHRVRQSCEVLASVFSCHIPAAEDRDNADSATEARTYLSELRERFHREGDVEGVLRAEGHKLATFAESPGVAVYIDKKLSLFGAAPPAEVVEALIIWLDSHQTDHVFSTDKLWEFAALTDLGAQAVTGLLSVRIAAQARDFVLWFRPAAVKVVEWAGNPEKPVEETESGRRISPRLSFERWKQTVGDRSEIWTPHVRQVVYLLRQMIAESLLTQRNLEISRLNTELQRSNIELDAFAYAASHDLQEPLRTIRAYSQLLMRRAEGALSNEDRKLLSAIDVGTSRMGKLLAALLEFAQVGGTATRGQRSVDLEVSLEHVLSNLKEAIRLAEASITHDRLPTVKADPEQMAVVLQNLVSNGLKYKKIDTPAILHISARQQGSEVLIGVHDNGSGFDPKHAETIFGAFKRLHGQAIPGTGLGLALCKRVVEAYGGRIWAESMGPGHGSTFWLTLPVD